MDERYNGDACGQVADANYIVKSRRMIDIMEMHADRWLVRTR